MHDTPSGTVEAVNFTLMGLEFSAFGADTSNTFNPAISFLVTLKVKDEVDSLWEKFLPGGQVLMDLGEYPFSGRYGWVQDKYGISWQLLYSTEQGSTRGINPVVMFVGAMCGRAEEAINFWTSVLPQSTIHEIHRYGKNEEPDEAGTIKHASFSLSGQKFRAMDSAYKHAFTVNEAVSFVISCGNQAEIDYYWNKLSAVPEAEACGWLKDKYGVSWQVLPGRLNEMMLSSDQEKIDRVTQALLPMKKLDLAGLEEAYSGK
jgi:predicted 3-demethylubiquinone-9 3-methyltransferase (glyoxalase superfamily)